MWFVVAVAAVGTGEGVETDKAAVEELKEIDATVVILKGGLSLGSLSTKVQQLHLRNGECHPPCVENETEISNFVKAPAMTLRRAIKHCTEWK